MLRVLRSKLVKKGISVPQFYREAKLVLMLEIRIFINGLLNVGHKNKIQFVSELLISQKNIQLDIMSTIWSIINNKYSSFQINPSPQNILRSNKFTYA